MNLQVNMEHDRGVLIVRLTGELDHHTADVVRMQMDEAIQKQQCKHLVLSLQDLQFMDSSGLGVILGRYKLIHHKGGKMVISGANPAVHRLLDMSGLFKIMPVFDNEGSALSGLEVVS
ncbi:anti-sigma F factor antagonist [Paenibacillus sp. J45TS6]|uniref:anti-sigma F factor antagonist n=1 Tax=unclassified Paenibacillus TaxID=185978 RepID=UPI001B09B4E4|nr:anti-sigma F factor antagonist [Paenibacillus sp. J45TS6]GIP41723.1 anti-sigma F factor antagonist [Paenibacillus sp. J45TS6]